MEEIASHFKTLRLNLTATDPNEPHPLWKAIMELEDRVAALEGASKEVISRNSQ